jgi:ABC-type phosphate transport system substrate-binding protein
MRVNWRKVLAGVVVGSSASLALVGQAGATTPTSTPANTGRDAVANQVLSGGSDTTYRMESDLSVLYNGSPGCSQIRSSYPLQCNPLSGSDPKGPNGADSSALNDNWDHDAITQDYPTGSGGGIAALDAGTLQIARSSKLDVTTTKHFYAYADDGLAVGTLGSRTPTQLTIGQLTQIWSCNVPAANGFPINTWGALLGASTLNPSDTIRVYGMNTTSGTYGTFKGFIGVDPDGFSCDNKVATLGDYPFENDFKPVVADANSKTYNLSDVIWFGSLGELLTYPYKADGANLWPIVDSTGQTVTPDKSNIQINPANISNPALPHPYPLRRYLFRAVLKADLDFSGVPGGNAQLVPGGNVNAITVTGSHGAAADYALWGCQPTSYFDAAGTNTALDPYTGATYATEVNGAITNDGFQRIPGVDRRFGACDYDQAMP